MSGRRQLEPKPIVPVQPAMVSQLTSMAVLGIDPRRYLELVVPHCTRVNHVGRLRVVRVDEAMRALSLVSQEATGGGEAAPVAAANDASEDEQPETADDFLASIGRRAR